MLSIFTVPKAFTGHAGVIQTNAIESWLRLAGDNEIILFGDDSGVGEVAVRYGLRHVPTIQRSEHGTPIISDAFAQADQIAGHDILCFVNADIILLDDFPGAVAIAAAARGRFLMAGRRTNLDITERLDFTADWQGTLRRRAVAEGRLDPWQGSDFFVYRRRLFAEIPPFAIGRPCWDNWLMYEARRVGAALIDATPAVRSVHQNHDYSHLASGEYEARKGLEARRNLELVGRGRHVYTVYDATLVLKRGRLVSGYRPWYWPRHARAALTRCVHPWLEDHPRIYRFLNWLRGRHSEVKV